MSSSSDRINEGLERLLKRQTPGQTFTASEIARECNCDDQAITYIERTAMKKFVLGLVRRYPGFLDTVFSKAKVTEITGQCESGTFRPNRGKTGRPATRSRKSVIEIFPTTEPVTELIEKMPFHPDAQVERTNTGVSGSKHQYHFPLRGA